MPSASRTLDLFGHDSLPEGFRYQADFLSGQEEHSLLEHIKVLPFREFEFHGLTGKGRIVSLKMQADNSEIGNLSARAPASKTGSKIFLPPP